MRTMQLTQVYLEPEQKQALRERAEARGSTLAQEARRAIDAYLAGVHPQEFELLDRATREAEKNITAMADDLERVNKKLNKMFRAMNRKDKQAQS